MDPVTERVLTVVAVTCAELGETTDPVSPAAFRFVGRLLAAVLPVPSDRPWAMPPAPGGRLGGDA